MTKLVSLLVVLCCFVGEAVAQQADIETKSFRTDVEIVQITINVTGKDGAAPKPLAQADFRLTENGVEQPLTLFVVEQPSGAMSRFTLGYESKAPQTSRKKIEVRIRGFKKPITRTLAPAKLPGTLFHF